MKRYAIVYLIVKLDEKMIKYVYFLLMTQAVFKCKCVHAQTSFGCTYNFGIIDEWIIIPLICPFFRLVKHIRKKPLEKKNKKKLDIKRGNNFF